MSLTPLRHLLAATPSAEAWRALLLHLDTYQPGDALDVALEYAQTHLQSWPDDLRAVPHRWLIQPDGGHPALSICRSLDLTDNDSPDLLLAVASPLNKLTTLELSLKPNHFDSVGALSGWPAARHLEHLRLSIFSQEGSRDYDPAVKKSTYSDFFVSKFLNKIRSVEIFLDSHSSFDEGVNSGLTSFIASHAYSLECITVTSRDTVFFKKFFKIKKFDHLRDLSLISRRHMPAEQVDLLVNGSCPETLERLEIFVNDETLQMLLIRPWPRLHTLVLVGPRLTQAGCQALANSEHLPALHTLKLSLGRKTCTEGGRALAHACWLPQLTSLTLKGPALGEDFTTDLLAEPAPWRLKTLDLSGGAIGGLGLHKLAQSGQQLAKLEHLRLHECEINSIGVQTLAESQAFSSLKTLDLSSNPITDDGARALASATHLHSLRTLKLDGCPIQARGLHALLASPLFNQLDTAHLDLELVQLDLGQHWLREGDTTSVYTYMQKCSAAFMSLFSTEIKGSPFLQNLTLASYPSVLDELLKLPPGPLRWELLIAFFTLLPTTCITSALLTATRDKLDNISCFDQEKDDRPAPSQWLSTPPGGHPALVLSNQLICYAQIGATAECVVRYFDECVKCDHLSGISRLELSLVADLPLLSLAERLGDLSYVNLYISHLSIDCFSNEYIDEIRRFVSATAPDKLVLSGQLITALLSC